MQYRGSLRRAVKARSSLRFGACIFGRLSVRHACVVFGNGTLVRRENVYPEPLSGVKMGVSARAVVNANQQQLRIEGDGCECIRGHAVNFAIQVNRHDSHTGGEASHRLSEFEWTDAHLADFPCSRLPTLPWQWPAGVDE